ncbi:hypothetical protein BKA70DRAFT_1409027 [Coprinopsis sp. MPI-PUGE-AT-0042]|nr:hypothetical protein BKA70DRAFT_1409027 [Coprinopsis sp. MPI-PUGE-AT-0042]
MASPPPPRRVIVDDLDPLVQFDGGGWFSVNDAKDGLGNFGPTYLSTQHGTNSSAQLSFTFDGSVVKLFGTNNPRSDLDPDWDCLVDGENIGKTDPSGAVENRWIFCEWEDGTPGEHTLTGRTFWVDGVEYTPSLGASVPTGSIISVPILDHAIKLGAGWGPLGGTANVTTKQGASAEVEFVGTRLSWWGFIPPQFARAPTTASYSVDGGPATSFALKGLAEDQGTVYNQKFFETPLLPSGPHRVFVVHGGNGQTTPLTLTNLLIEGGNSTSPLPGDPSIFAPGSSSPPSESDGASTTGGSKPPIAAIVGGVLGGLAIITATMIVAFFIIRRHRTNARSRANEYVVPFDSVVAHPPTHDKGGGNTNNSDRTAPMNPTYHAVPHQEQTLGQGLAAPNWGHKRMLSGSTDQGTSDPPGSHGHASPPPPPNPSRNASNSIYPSPPLSTNTSSAGPNIPHTHLGSSANGSRVVMHEDSGVRMDAQGNTIEVPPLYTVQ